MVQTFTQLHTRNVENFTIMCCYMNPPVKYNKVCPVNQLQSILDFYKYSFADGQASNVNQEK